MTTTSPKKATTRRFRVLTILGLSFGLVAVSLLGGCHQKRDGRVSGSDFRPEGEPRAIHRFAEAQTAAGARTDATLRAYDFDCGDLNSLGQQKLDLMLKDDDACSPLVVYLDVAPGATYDPRQESVRVYLKDRGLLDTQIKLVAGPNTNNLGPTAPALREEAARHGAPVAVNPEPAGSPSAANTSGAK